MPIKMMKTARKALTLMLLTAASFWLFACQAHATMAGQDTQSAFLTPLFAGLALLGLAYSAQVLRMRTFTQERL